MISMEDVRLWKNTRLLIVDEISFASAKILDLLDEKLRILRQMPTKQCGGLNIHFGGDLVLEMHLWTLMELTDLEMIQNGVI